MENYSSESRYDDDDSHESSSSDTPSASRRVALPASALHGLGLRAQGEAPKVEVPRFENVLAAEHQRRQQEASRNAEHEHKHESDEEDEDTDDAPAAPAVPVARKSSEDEYTELPLHKHDEVQEAELAETPLPNDTSETPVAELSDEAVDEQFKQLIDVHLGDLQNLDLPKTEQEPYTLNPSVEHAAQVQPFPSAGEVTPLASVEQSTADHAADFAAWESELSDTNNVEPPRPPIPPQGPAPHLESFNRPEENTVPEGQTGTGGGGNVPPVPPFGASGEMPSHSPEPEPLHVANTAHNMARPRGFMESVASVLPAAEMLMINNKLQRAEFARRRGDAVTGLIAGWALVRTFRNRNMIRNDRRENQEALQKQQKSTAEVSQQNTLLQQRLNQVEQRQVAQQQAMPNRFRPIAEAPIAANMAPKPGVTPEAQVMLERQRAERTRLVHEQHEESLRQQAMEVAPENELVRPQWLSVEVNKQTGKAVEKPTSFEYGQAFKNEQRREQLQDKMADSSTSQQAAGGVGGFLGTAAAQTQFPGQQMPQQPYGPGPLPPLAPPTKQSKKELVKSTSQQLSTTVTSPWFWVAVITLLIVFFTAAWF
jgi:hypothetical protein